MPAGEAWWQWLSALWAQCRGRSRDGAGEVAEMPGPSCGRRAALGSLKVTGVFWCWCCPSQAHQWLLAHGSLRSVGRRGGLAVLTGLAEVGGSGGTAVPLRWPGKASGSPGGAEDGGHPAGVLSLMGGGCQAPGSTGRRRVRPCGGQSQEASERETPDHPRGQVGAAERGGRGPSAFGGWASWGCWTHSSLQGAWWHQEATRRLLHWPGAGDREQELGTLPREACGLLGLPPGA